MLALLPLGDQYIPVGILAGLYSAIFISLTILLLGGALEDHHVVKRAQGGSDFDLDRLVALCPPCHAKTDAPYEWGRLGITPLGGGQFTFEIRVGPGKQANEVLDRWHTVSSPNPTEPHPAKADSFE